MREVANPAARLRGRSTATEGLPEERSPRHHSTLHLQKKIWTMGGLVDYFALFFIHIGSRRVYLAGVTTSPTQAWVAQQARNMAAAFQDQKEKPTHVIRDNDSKFSDKFDAVFESEGVEVVKTCIRAPNMNAHLERWIQSFQVECLDHFVILGEDHFRHLIASYLTYYNERRPHQSLGNKPLDGVVLEPPEN